MAAEILNIIAQMPCLDIEKAKKFYTGYLNCAVVSEYPELLILTLDGLEFHLWLCDDKNICENSSCYISVQDIDNIYDRYKHLACVSARPEVKAWGMREFYIIDDSGNLLKFGERTA